MTGADIRIEIQENAAPTVRHQQEVIDDWVQEFNFVRPHEALGLIPPGDVYRRSPRRPGKLVVGGFPDGWKGRLPDQRHSLPVRRRSARHR